MIIFTYIFFFIFSNSAYAYIDPGFLSSLSMYLFMIINFLVLVFFVHPKEIIKKFYYKFFKKKEDINNDVKNDIKKDK